ncbi:ras-specific guanine nucleotide-releasing factor 2 isoform X4 [Labeo rohita]|uniref:Ras-specific guanine nucleotide-releasing factor 2 isoform X4 n=1 Tax=Labeo rohita TaxID=84645 RepID=A0A498MH02_LABRO|nr:ras-specific guanine nucleotide-releasing factor 2 isoform X4 [Labeo rohita]
MFTLHSPATLFLDLIFTANLLRANIKAFSSKLPWFQIPSVQDAAQPGIYLSDLTYIDSAYPSTGSILENEQRSNLMNNILRIISDLQRSVEYDIPVLPHVQKYLNSVRYIEELQKFVEDDNYKLSLKIEPPATSTPRTTASREDLTESEELAVHLYPGAVTVQGVLRRKTVLKEGKKPTVAAWTKYWVALCGTQLYYYTAKSLKATERKHFKSTASKSVSVLGLMAMMADDPEHPDVFLLTDSEHGPSEPNVLRMSKTRANQTHGELLSGWMTGEQRNMKTAGDGGRNKRANDSCFVCVGAFPLPSPSLNPTANSSSTTALTSRV